MKKQQSLDFGSVHVHSGVLADIVKSVVEEIDGVSLVSEDFYKRFVGLLNKNEHVGVNIDIDENQDVSIEVLVVVRYGLNIPDIAHQIQDLIKKAIEKTVNIHLKDININVQGIEKKEAE